MVLTQEEIDGCREAFLAFDKDRSGTIDVWGECNPSICPEIRPFRPYVV